VRDAGEHLQDGTVLIEPRAIAAVEPAITKVAIERGGAPRKPGLDVLP